MRTREYRTRAGDGALIRMATKIRISEELGIEIPSVDQFRELSGWKGVDG